MLFQQVLEIALVGAVPGCDWVWELEDHPLLLNPHDDHLAHEHFLDCVLIVEHVFDFRCPHHSNVVIR